jgi:hypothetical protein
LHTLERDELGRTVRGQLLDDRVPIDELALVVEHRLGREEHGDEGKAENVGAGLRRQDASKGDFSNEVGLESSLASKRRRRRTSQLPEATLDS